MAQQESCWVSLRESSLPERLIDCLALDEGQQILIEAVLFGIEQAMDRCWIGDELALGNGLSGRIPMSSKGAD